MNFVQFLNLASGTAANGANAGKSQISLIVMMVLLFAVMYFVMIRPQKKKQKEEQQMRDSIEVGDEITTIGGIVGRVVTVKDDSLIIETGAERNRIKIMRWAISTNNTANEKLEAERAAAKEAQEAEKKKSVKDMSDAELRAKISRLQLEKQYADLSRQTEPVSKGKKFVEGIMTKSGENIGTQLTTYVMGTAVNKALAGVFKDEAIVNPKKGQKDK